MAGILLITHGRYGEDLLVSASHVLGRPLEHAAHMAISTQDDPDAALIRARELLHSVDDGGGVLVMTDIYGATPCNIASRLLAEGRVEGVSGVSLPMLVRALAYRAAPLATVRDKAVSGGTEGVVHINSDPCRAQR
ncbi:MAG: PTS fructose transporter subunit IIA [Betaproteobacteria bacterium]|jgi:PTS system mannose-specific IIA component|nr:PTS fructose transporter subunit IIA [Betaproteobacteria bacterium]